MNSPTRTFPWTILIGLLLICFTLALVFLLTKVKSQVSQKTFPVYSQVQDFSLTNQNDVAVSLADLRGHVWVADIIFTRCAGPCPRMTRQMKELQDKLPSESPTKLVTITTDPDHDTPAILARYAERFEADGKRWLFLTGTKSEIGRLAIDGLKLSAVEKKPEDQESSQDLFIHSTIFVVVDQRGQLRGIFETGGEGVDWEKSKQQILATVAQLERAK
jgi:protein SCO1